MGYVQAWIPITQDSPDPLLCPAHIALITPQGLSACKYLPSAMYAPTSIHHPLPVLLPSSRAADIRSINAH